MFQLNDLPSAIWEVTSSLEAHQMQRAVIEFLVLEDEIPINIFNSLEKVYRDSALGYSAVKMWVSVLKAKKKIQV